MTRCRWRAALLAGLLVGVATLAVLLLLGGRHPRIDRNSFNRIEEGMAQQEVEAVLGAPPGDYTFGKQVLPEEYFHFHANAAIYMGWQWEEWTSDEGGIVLTFDRDGKVVQKYFHSVEGAPDRTLLEKVQLLARRVSPHF